MIDTTITAGATYVRLCHCPQSKVRPGELAHIAACGHLYRVECLPDAADGTGWLALVVGLTGPDEGRWVVYGGGMFVARFERVEDEPDVPAVAETHLSEYW